MGGWRNYTLNRSGDNEGIDRPPKLGNTMQVSNPAPPTRRHGGKHKPSSINGGPSAATLTVTTNSQCRRVSAGVEIRVCDGKLEAR